MISTPNVLVPGTFLANGAPTLLYQSPANGKGTWIDTVTACNDNAGAQTMTLHIVPSGGAVGAANQVAKAKSIGIGVTDLVLELRGKFLKPGDAIWGGASAASAIAMQINGRERTDA